MSDKITHGVILDVVEQDAEITLEAMDYENFAPGKPFRSGSLTFPETANNRAALNTLFDTDGANKVRIIEGVTYENDITTIKGKLIITGQTNEQRINKLSGFFLAGNGLLWVDFGDKRLKELDWSAYNHTLNITNQMAGNALCLYDLCDRGKNIDSGTYNLIERYPAFNIAEMLRVIFLGYDLKSNFLSEDWFTEIYLLFTQINEIRNTDDWKTSALVQASGGIDADYDDTFLNIWTDFDYNSEFHLSDTGGDNFDNGSNFDLGTHTYTIPETGTYRFKLSGTFSGFTDDGTGTEAQMRYNSGGGNPMLRIRCRVNGTTTIAQLTTQDYDFVSMVPIEVDIDTDYIELQEGDEITFDARLTGQYYVTSPPGTRFNMTLSCPATMTNQVSRYYGYGSTVQISDLMPDIKVNDFLKMLFQHFAIVPQYSYETNIVRLNVYKRTNTHFDISNYVDPTTGQCDYMEGFSFDLMFTEDGSDNYAKLYFSRNLDLDGNYESSNDYKVSKAFRSSFSNTVMQAHYQITTNGTYIPVLWQTVPESSGIIEFSVFPEWRTTFNYRLLRDSGTTIPINIGYHVATNGRTVTEEDCPVLTSYGLEFTGLNGLYERLHKAPISRLNNGTTLTIQGRLPLTYLNNLINCDNDFNLTTSVYIAEEPYKGRYTIQSITNNGKQDQLVLILNDE